MAVEYKYARVVIDLRTSKTVENLDELVAARAWSIDGVEGCEIIRDVSIPPGVYKFTPVPKPAEPEPKKSFWGKLKEYFW